MLGLHPLTQVEDANDRVSPHPIRMKTQAMCIFFTKNNYLVLQGSMDKGHIFRVLEELGELFLFIIFTGKERK